MATRYRIRRKDQWGEVCYVVDGERIWRGDQARVMADFVVEQDPYNSDCCYIKRENTHGEKLYYLQPNPHGEGQLVREKDAWGTVLFFVEGSRWSSEALLVREGDQHGAVAWYVEPYDFGGGGDTVTHREPNALDHFISNSIRVLSDIKRRYGTAGVVGVTLAWIAFLTFIFIFVLDLGFVGSLLYGALVMGGVLFIASHAV